MVKISFHFSLKRKKEHFIKCSRDEIHFVKTTLFYKERNTEYYMRFLLIECIFTDKEQPAKANCSVLQGGTGRKSNVI